jgi:hypothetical protein
MHDAGDTGRTRADTPPNPSRRGLLAGSTAAALIAGAAAVTAAAVPSDPAGPDAELVRLHQALVAQTALIARIQAELLPPGITAASKDKEERLAAADDKFWDLIDEMTAMPAQSAAGQRAKAGALLLALRNGVCLNINETLADIASGEVGYPEHRLALSLASDILAGRAAT